MRETVGTRLKTPAIELPREAVADFCRRNRIRRLALFGSVMRTDFGPESDLDVLVEFEPDAVLGFRFFGLADDLAAIVGRKVDLVTPGGLSRYIRDQVLAEAFTIYDAAG